MRIRTALMVTAVACAGLAPAHAAPRKSCNLVIDARGDTRYALVAVPMIKLDVVSADIASDARRFAAAVRVADLEGQDASAGVSRIYRVMWRGQGGRVLYAFSAVVPATGEATFEFGVADRSQTFIPLGKASGKVDVAKDEIRMWADLPALLRLRARGAGALSVGSKQSDIAAETFTSNGWNFDTASGGRSTYTAGTPSCLPVGR